MKAMILAAGLGTRLKPFTDKHPKALAVVNNKTLLQRNIEYLSGFGITEIIVNVHHFADQIINHIDQLDIKNVHISISDETKEVLETGGGLLKAAHFFNDDKPFVLINVDILTTLNLSEIINLHNTNNALATLAVSKRNSSRCFLFDEEKNLCGWRNKNTNEEKISVEKKEHVEFSFSGIHVINPTIFKYITQQGKFSMVDVYLDLCKNHIIKGFDHTGIEVLDVGKPESIAKAETMFL